MAQRLPTNVRPEHYTLQLTPDLDKATFSGEETIDVTLAQAADSITLNAAEIQFQSVTANAGKRDMKADVSLDEGKQQATFSFPGTLPAGPVKLKIAYTGILNDKLRGFYLSKAEGHRYAVTQFESTDARRAFPIVRRAGLQGHFRCDHCCAEGRHGDLEHERDLRYGRAGPWRDTRCSLRGRPRCPRT